MKLLKPKTGYWVFGGGNVNTVTTLVEVRWLEFRTGVRFPSSPPNDTESNRAFRCRFLFDREQAFRADNAYLHKKNSNCGLPCVFHKIDTFIRYTQNKKKDTLLKKESVDVNLIW